MQGMTYTATAVLAAVTTAQNLLHVVAPADAVVVLLKVQIGQFTLDTSEDYEVEIRTRAAAGTGSAVTPTAHQTGFAAAGSVWDSAATGATGGVVLINLAGNVLSPLIWHPTPEEYIYVSPSGVLEINTTTTLTSTDVNAFATFMEIGG